MGLLSTQVMCTEVNGDSDIFSKRGHETIFKKNLFNLLSFYNSITHVFLQANKGKDVRM